MAFLRNGHPVLWMVIDVAPVSPHMLTMTTDLMDDLLTHFKHVFMTLVGLPPVRDHCHRIWLLSGTESVAVRPYRYAHHQKAELERQCHDMLG
jgi:hypothetical protein